jgi:hypothetical protein
METVPQHTPSRQELAVANGLEQRVQNGQWGKSCKRLQGQGSQSSAVSASTGQ